METGGHVVQILLALTLVVGLVLALGFALRRINTGSFKSGGDIRVVASTFLGPKERLLLVEVKDRQILLGVNAQSIRALGEFAADGGAADAVSDDAVSFERALEEAGA